MTREQNAERESRLSEAASLFCSANAKVGLLISARIHLPRCTEYACGDAESGDFGVPRCCDSGEAEHFWCDPCIKRRDHYQKILAAKRARTAAKGRLMRAWKREWAKSEAAA